MTTLREAAQKALETLEAMNPYPASKEAQRANTISALRAALEQQEPELAAVVGTQSSTWVGYSGQWFPPGPPIKTVHLLLELPEGTPLYAAVPPQRKPLTDAEIAGIYTNTKGIDFYLKFARAIEAAHGIKEPE